MDKWNHQITYAAGFLGLLLVTVTNARSEKEARQSFVAPAQPNLTLGQLQSPELPFDAVLDRSSPRQLQFSLSVSTPADLKVKEGDRIVPGQVLADRARERATLETSLKALQLSLEQIESATLPEPLSPANVPEIDRLPPISYAEEEAAIQSASLAVQQAQRAFELQQQHLQSAPIEETSGVDRALVEVQNRQRLLDNQKRKLEAVAVLKDLPKDVSLHEEEVLKQKQANLQQGQADLRLAQSKLSAATALGTQKLQQLSADLEKARAGVHLATAKLQTKKDGRAYAEYEASIAAARRTEEKNQAQGSHQEQLNQVRQQRRDKDFQIAQIAAKISEAQEKLAALSVITSPYAGVVKRLKIVGQNNQNLSVELVLAVGAASPSSFSNRNAPIAPSPVTSNKP